MGEPAFEVRAARPRVAAKARRLKLLTRRVILIILAAFWLATIFGFLVLLVSQQDHKYQSVPPPGSEPPASAPSPPPKSPDRIASLHTENPTPEGETESTVSDADLNYLASRNLLIPVAGVTANQLRDSFNQARSGARPHRALDIMAPQGTPVLATSDGVVLKLYQSANGGITLYQLDSSNRYAFYYAHLMRYADDIAEGKRLMRGDTLGYVGDTGNAGTGNFHLHFAISKLGSPRRWSGGEPINPYPLLVGK
jgi:murein DD-endopeptidase MepM/ murein hydrolase activator NlpD